MGSAEAAAAAEPLKYQTWVLKVSIHCEGCKRKVKKVLQSIEGVYTTVVDMPQQRVTVTGNIDADFLIKRLLRTGKHAELLPQPQKPQQPKKESKKGGDSPTPNKEKKEPPPPKEKKNDPKAAEKDDVDGDPKATDDDAKPPTPQTPKPKNNPPTGGNEEKSGKKKEKKSPNPKESQVQNPDAAGAGAGAGAPHPQHFLQQIYQQYPAYHPQPVYAVSYNVAQPAASQGYYMAPPPETALRGYVYGPPATVRLPHNGGGNNPYDVMFSDENAHACSVM